jgi:hypothetical protein
MNFQCCEDYLLYVCGEKMDIINSYRTSVGGTEGWVSFGVKWGGDK